MRNLLIPGFLVGGLCVIIAILLSGQFPIRKAPPENREVIAASQASLIPPNPMVALVSRLKVEEGFSAYTYLDTRGITTIGYGTNLSRGITEAEAEGLLRTRLNDKRISLRSLWKPFADQPVSVRAALLDMAYQLGTDGVLEFHDMLYALERKDYEGAAEAAEASNWDLQTPRRVERIVEVFRDRR